MRDSNLTLYCGLDLGESVDYSAFSVVQVEGNNYELKLLNRIRGREYEEIAQQVYKFWKTGLMGATSHKYLLIDSTGVGRPVLERLQFLIPRARGIFITAGQGSSVDPKDPRNHRVGKKVLISTLQIAASQRRLDVPENLKLGRVFKDELRNYDYKQNPVTGYVSTGARSGKHDDLVLSVAMSIWYPEKGQNQKPVDRFLWSPAMGRREFWRRLGGKKFGSRGSDAL